MTAYTDPLKDFRAAILAVLGCAPDVIEPGRFHRFPTNQSPGDTAGWAKLFPDLRGGVFGCYRAGVAETWSAVDRARMTRHQQVEWAQQLAAATAERKAQQREAWARAAENIARTWSECVPLVPGDPVTLYLKRRGLGGVWPLPDVLRLHRALPYWHAGERLGAFPAMVAPLRDAAGRLVTLHRTFVTSDGRKADVPTVRKLTAAAGSLAGACIPLHKPRGGVIGISEGIETALAAWCASGVPTVAAYCAGSLSSWAWPPGVQRLVIFSDADRAGREAAESLRARAQAAGLAAEVLAPSEEGADWLDVWARRWEVSAEGSAA